MCLNCVKIVYPKLLTSSIGLGFFKDYHKYIKVILGENVSLSFKTKPVT